MEQKGISASLFEKKIKPILIYVGTIGAVLSAVAYVILIFTMIFGLTIQASIQDTLIFACVNAIIGFVIMQFLKIQGISFAKNYKHSVDVSTKWRALNPIKDKRKHSLKHFWFVSIVKDIITRVLLIVITTICIIYLVIKGTHDYTYLLLMFVNLIMFACFGLISLVNAHDFYIEQHIPYLEEQIHEKEREEAERKEAAKAKTKRSLAVDKKKSAKQGNSDLRTDRGSDILEPCNHNGDSRCNCGSEVLCSCGIDNSVLGSTIHTGLDNTNSTNTGLEESLAENKTEETEK
jgi:hypothetical protein